MTIEEILNSGLSAEQKIAALSEKNVNVPVWGGAKGLEKEYNPLKHPVMDKATYPDIVNENGIQKVTRIALGFQKLAVKRMTELVTGIPVRRVYKPKNDKQKEVAAFLEAVNDKCHIDTVNTKRLHLLFSCCEIMTLWYAVEQDNFMYGVKSKLKLRCQTFSPKDGDNLFPIYDEYGDLIALSVGYNRKRGRKSIHFFDTYTASRHVKFSDENGKWEETMNEDISIIGKIPAVYAYREQPIWEEYSNNVYEMEWSLSRDGNYLRDNSKPLFAVFADEDIETGNEKGPDEEGKGILQYPKGSTAQYITWQQATDNLKFFISELRNTFFTLLQLPDWSYEKMSQVALSGESRKQMFIDAQLKVKDEKGPLIEFFEREVNVQKQYAKVIFGEDYADDIDALKVEIVITPFSITDEKDDVDILMTANGGKPVMSQRESIERFGRSDDVDKTLKEIKDEETLDSFNLTA